MGERNKQPIKEYLEQEDVRRRIKRLIQKGRDEATVTISRAAELFKFSEHQLRDWEDRGLLTPLRPTGAKGRRLYTTSELDKLAVIRELWDAGYALSDIAPNIASFSLSPNHQDRDLEEKKRNVEDVRVSQSIGYAKPTDLFWRYYASRILLFSLMLVYKYIPGSVVGLILPIKDMQLDDSILDVASLHTIGDSLIGWLDQAGLFHTFLTSRPPVEYPGEFRMLPLPLVEKQESSASILANRALIIVQRDRAMNLNFDEKIINLVQCLLAPLHEDKEGWSTYFSSSMPELVYPGMDFTSKIAGTLLSGLTDIVIRLGGKKADGKNRWYCSYILLPDNPRLPLHQRSLVVRAKSERAGHSVGETEASPDRSSTSLGLKAYQSGHIMYRSELGREDITPLSGDIEGPVCSCIAVPIGGETGQPLGVLYVTSYYAAAFDEEDQRVLRVAARIIEELLRTYSVQQQVVTGFTDLIKDPSTVDVSFKEFFSENDFMRDVETILTTIREKAINNSDLQKNKEVLSSINNYGPHEISFIAIEIDDQERIANSYGDQTLRNLSRTIGQLIRDLLPAHFKGYTDWKLYYIYGCRFYLFLHGFSLEKTKSNAERLRKALESSILVKQPDLPSSTLVLPRISAHLGVTWYSYEKLKEFFEEDRNRSVADVSSTLYHSLDFTLKRGTSGGGNIVFAWNAEVRTYTAYPASDEKR